MTSAVTLEDIRAELYSAGVRNTFTLSRLTNMVTLYALAQTRKAVPLEDVFADTHAHLLPGDWDSESRVTRCAKCAKAKAWTHFGVDKTHPTRHKVTCKSCLRVRPRDGYEQRWKCPACGQKKAPDEFGENKRKNPRVRDKCLPCEKNPVPA